MTAPHMPELVEISESQQTLTEQARQLAPACDYWSVRVVHENAEHLEARQDVVAAPARSADAGLMVTVAVGNGQAYAASPDTSAAGIKEAFRQARDRALELQTWFAGSADASQPVTAAGSYRSPMAKPIPASLAERINTVRLAGEKLRLDDRIVDWQASLTITHSEQLFVSSNGGPVVQAFDFIVPNLLAVARLGDITQTRTLAGRYNGYCRQGGWEILDACDFTERGAQIAAQAIALTQAPNCPAGTMDVVLMPDQMMLQIHESIGHPLELDRILGDERNFAGTSFVRPEMFGNYQYGSELLNVSYAPDVAGQYASFAFDDEGLSARRSLLIDKGQLIRPLGGSASARRAEGFTDPVQAVATTRACSWNRAPIDRMSNLNIEAGNSSVDEMIASIGLGVMMYTNASWSIDDARNKFQFGCEYGQMIRDGKLAEVVRNPNYRGVSASFWRNLNMVGDASTVQVMGTPFCGKGEPMQVIRVGHASPACKFTNVDVFGGAH